VTVRRFDHGVLGPAGGLARALDGYEDRPEQRRMAEAVAAALEDGRPLLAEAGTGTGKTLAYLAPAAESGLRVVVSTGTRALQEQIASKDLPLLERLLGRRVEAVVLKGVSNYLCRRKLRELELGTSLFDDVDVDRERLLGWAQSTQHGDRGELASLDDGHPLWERVTTTPDARLGPRCGFFDRCFVTRARRAADKASIIVVNHHLFFADLAVKDAAPGAKVLPDYDAVVFDEAHLLEEVMTEHFGVAVSSSRLALLGRDLREAWRRRGDASAAGDADQLDHLVRQIDRSSAALFDQVRVALRPSGDGVRVPLPHDLFSGGPRKDAWLALDAALDDAAVAAEVRADRVADDGDSDLAEEHTALARRAGTLREALAAIAEPAASRHQHVQWGEVRGRGMALRAAPIDVSDVLHRRVLAKVPGAIFTSATLAAAGSFSFARARLGLHPDHCDEALFESPFDYSRQAMLYVPRDLPPPGTAGFDAAACARIRELIAITDGRAFVLFTSHRALRSAEAQLADLPYPLLVQGQAPPAILLDRFSNTAGAVLLATGTFWAGVDVPGDALSLVIMDKLPFAPPTDPLVAARMRRIEEDGGEPFLDYQLPQAAVTFKQGFGRLIRRRDDRGIVAVLDARLLGKRYGQAFLSSLPTGLRRTSALEPLRRFFTGHGDDARRPASDGAAVAP
jgi:ATP-dependent DNA helicase DinG